MIILPYNITASVTQGENGQGEAIIKWNQELNFYDSFEDYADFSVGSFGGWRTLDLDMMPVYPIGLGSASNIVWFPGAGTPTSPAPIAPMVFNPWNTQPAMMPTDNAIAAPTGDKTIIFFSPQQAKADKWLISPEIEVREDYSCQVTMKSYDGMYLESADFCVSTEGEDPSSFTTISAADRIPSTEWTRYEADLSAYANKKVRIGIHYRSYDTFLLQLDDFTVGPKDGSTTFVDFGNVIRFEIYIDGVKIGSMRIQTFHFSVRHPDVRHELSMFLITFLSGNDFKLAMYFNENIGRVGFTFEEATACNLRFRLITDYPYLNGKEEQKQKEVLGRMWQDSPKSKPPFPNVNIGTNDVKVTVDL